MKKAENAAENLPAVQVAAALPSVAEKYTFMEMADRAIFEANLGGEAIKPFDLPRLKVPSGESNAWTVPSFEGDDEPEKVIEGIIVSWREVRSFWSTKFGDGETAPPDCAAQDGKRGVGIPGGFCELCPNAQFGSAIDNKGNPAPGQACKAGRLLFFMMPGNILPAVVSVPPTSIKAIRQYFVGLISRGIPFHGCITQLGLQKTKNGGGTAYNLIVPKKVANLSEEDAAKVKAYASTIQDALNKVNLERTDVDGADSAEK